VARSKALASAPIRTSSASNQPIFAVVAVLLGSVLTNFDTRLFSIALPDLRGAFSLSFDEGAWLSTVTTASQIFVAPAVAWLATAFGLRRVLGLPSLLYAAVSLIMPLTTDYGTLLFLGLLHGLLLGTFVPATLLIIFRNLPMNWWAAALAIFSIRVGLSLNSGISVVGFYVAHIGWQWIFWQDALIAPLIGLFVYLGTPHQSVNRELVRDADWGGMLLLGAGMALIYSGLDQGNRLDWLDSGAVLSLLIGGIVLTLGFFLNESLVRRPWAHVDVILSRNIGLAFLFILFYTLTSLSNSSLAPNFLAVVAQLRPEQSGTLFLTYAVVPMVLLTPLSIYLIKHYDARLFAVIGLSAFAAAGLLGTQLTHDWSINDFIPMVLLQSVGHSLALFAGIMIALANIDLAKSTAFVAYVQVVRLGSAEIGVALMTTWLRVREQFQSNLLGQHVASSDSNVTDFLSKLAGFFDSPDSGLAQARGVATLAALVQREANTLAYIDGFWLTFCFALLGLVSVALMTAPPAGPFTPKT
jgi:DHA2 family multidrug resistance protein